MSSKSVIRSKLRKCQSQFNESWGRNLTADVRRLQKERNDFLLGLLGPTGDNDQLHKLYLIYYDLMLKAMRGNNHNEIDYYKAKIAEVKYALRSNKAI